MTPFIGAVENASSWAAEVLIGSVLTGLLLVGCVGLLLRAFPRLSATTRSTVWAVVLLSVLCAPLLPIHSGSPSSPSAGLVHASAWSSLLIAAVWLLLSLLRFGQLAISASRLRSVARAATPADVPAPVQELLRRSARRPLLRVSGDVSRPSVAGFFRPSILLPAGLLEELSSEELEHVVLHELEHLRRRDDWINLLQKLGIALFPLHPALLWLDRKLSQERELACDDGVLRVTQSRKAYAACLARLAEESLVRRGLTLALGLLGVGPRKAELFSRVQRILRGPVVSMGRIPAAAAACTGIVLAAAAPVFVTHLPRLVSFSPLPQNRTVMQARAVVPTPLRALGMTTSETMSPAPRSTTATQVTMRMAAQQPHVLRASAQISAHSGRLPHLVLAAETAPAHVLHGSEQQVQAQDVSMRAPAEQAYTMFAAFQQFQQQMLLQRANLTVATQSGSKRLSQPTYAAVPVEGGWLVFQL